jgi:hypothetical protein
VEKNSQVIDFPCLLYDQEPNIRVKLLHNRINRYWRQRQYLL